MQIIPQLVLTAWCPFLHCHWVVVIINSRPLPLLRWLLLMTGCVSYPYPLRMTSLTSEGRSGLMCGPTPPSKKIGGDCLLAPVMICPQGRVGVPVNRTYSFPNHSDMMCYLACPNMEIGGTCLLYTPSLDLSHIIILFIVHFLCLSYGEWHKI